MASGSVYEIMCNLPPDLAVARVANLLSREGMTYTSADLRISSTRMPFVMVGIDPRFYSRNNWLGVNPFAFISGITARCEPVDERTTRVVVRVDRGRTVLWAAFWIACGLLVGLAMPEPAGVFVFGTIACAAWVGHLVNGYLVKKEITNELVR